MITLVIWIGLLVFLAIATVASLVWIMHGFDKGVSVGVALLRIILFGSLLTALLSIGIALSFSGVSNA